MEHWDIYDENRKCTGRSVLRGERLMKGDFHLVVFAIVRTSEGQFLISKRSKDKTYPNTWEVTGGSAIVGESSIAAAKREVYEELGISLKSEGVLLDTVKVESECSNFSDVWYFEEHIDVKNIVCQQGEVETYKLTSFNEIQQLFDDGLFMVGNKHVFKCLRKLINI